MSTPPRLITTGGPPSFPPRSARPKTRAIFRLYLAREIWLLGEREAAYAELARAQRDAERLRLPEFTALAAYTAGDLAAAGGDLAAARRWHAQALEAARSSVDAPVIAQALTGLADLALREADPGHAAELLGAAEAIRGTVDRTVRDEERVASAARAELGAAGFEAAYERGQSVTTDTLATLVPQSHLALER